MSEAHPPGSTNPPPQADIQTKTSHVMDNSPADGIEIQVESCTQKGKAPSPGGINADGHEHDGRTNVCIKGIGPAINHRPFATLEFLDKIGNPIIVTTDIQGVAVIKYTPPNYINLKPNSALFGYTYYISGEDILSAKLIDFPSVKTEKNLTTRVPNLNSMPGSEICPPGPGGILYGNAKNYFFEKQGFHGCSFYGTDETNLALNRIANEYANLQRYCKLNFGNPACKVPSEDNSLDVNGNWDPSPSKWTDVDLRNISFSQPIKITAMSLPWGGLLDIGPKYGIFWQTPHSTHNNGKVVDIGFLDKKGVGISSHQKLLLRYVISMDLNFNSIEKCEGNFNILKPNASAKCTKATDHIHAYFTK